MRNFAQALDLVDDPQRITEYRDWHTRVWPEVIEGLKRIGITRMQIFLHGTRLFMYFQATDAFDPQRDYASYAADPRTQEWDQMMRRYQKQIPGADPNVWWTPMELIFDLETA